MVAIFYLEIAALTFIISTAFSTAGIGGANTLIPVYFSLGIPFSLAAATGLLLNVFSLSTATANHARNRHIDWRLGILLLIPAVIMAPIGALVGVNTPRQFLLMIFVAFLIYSIYSILRSGKRRLSRSSVSMEMGLIASILIGSFAGFMGGLLGVGGGIIILPILAFIESDFKKVAGTSGFVALFISISGFLSYLEILKSVSYVLWAVVIAAGMSGGYLGSILVDRFQSQSIRYVVASIMAVVSANLLYSIISQILT